MTFLRFRQTTLALAALAALLLTLVATPAFSQDGDGHFIWPLGNDSPDGDFFEGHDYFLLQNFAEDDGPFRPRFHAGADFSVKGDVGATQDDPVYAIADGTVLCTNLDTNDARQDYPGKVVVVRHRLPDGRTVYSQYAHLNFCQDDPNNKCAGVPADYCDPDWQNAQNLPPCVQPGDAVSRGEQIGTITRWREDGVYDDGNSHLHFEIRTFQYWDYQNDVPTTEAPNANRPRLIGCAGRGYALPGETAIADHYLDPISFIHQHQPAPPTDTLVWDQGALDVYQQPTDTAAAVGTLAANAEVRALGLVRDDSYDCDTHPCRIDCAEANCDQCSWWHRVRLDDGTEGFVKSYDQNVYDSDIHLGEAPLERDAWERPEEPPLIEWQTLGDGPFPGRTFQNLGTDPTLDVDLVGGFQWVPILPNFPDNVVELDGATGFFETARDAVIDTSGGFHFEASSRRLSEDGDDVIAGQWHASDPDRQSWRLAFEDGDTVLPGEGGVLVLRVRLEDGEEIVLRHPIHECEGSLGWHRVMVRFHSTEGLELYWDGRQVATADDPRLAALEAPSEPLRIGGTTPAETASDLDRFDGAFEVVRVWADAPVGGAAADSVLIIDSSGSMSSNDPSGQRRHAAWIYFNVSPDNDHVGVVDFDSIVQEANTTPTLYRLGDEDVRADLRAYAYRIDSSGGTHIGRGLARSCALLEAFTEGNPTKSAVLLTDGVGPWSAADRACFDQEGWSLWAIGFGGASASQLAAIVGSSERALVVDSAEKALCELQQIRAQLTGGDTIPCTQRRVHRFASVIETVVVPPGRGALAFYTSWPGSDVETTLTSPSGRIYDRSTSEPGVRHDNGPTYEFYVIESPEAGEWTIELYGLDVPAAGEDVTFGGSLLQPGDLGTPNLPPDVSAAAADPYQLWPPNHKMVEIEVTGVVDPEGEEVTITVTGVTQDEPVPGPGNKHSPDAEGVGNATASLRSERDGGGDGRVYEIVFTATDESGATAEGRVQVCVPHDQGSGTCVDSGQVYDSTAP